MDRTLQYTQSVANFESAYNVAREYQPLSSSSSILYSTFYERPTSPLFHRCNSPPVRKPIIPIESVPKFNFDLYKMDKTVDEYDNYIPMSPPTSRTIYHYPIVSPLSSPVSKLRQINRELSQSLVQSDYPDPLAFSSSSSAAAPAPHYHIHHYPLSQYSPTTRRRCASISDDGASSIEVPVPSNIRKARVVYKIHVPRRTQNKSTANIDSNNDQIVVDLYPTREEAFVKQRKKPSDHNRSPWIVTGKSLQYDSNSDASTSETPRDIYYGDKLVPSSHRSTQRPSSTKQHERIWYPPRQATSQDSQRSNKYLIRNETESEPISHRKPSSDRTKVRTDDPKIKKRIADAKSKVKTTWEPTVTSLREPTNDTTPNLNIKSIPSEPKTPTKTNRETTSKNETTNDDNDAGGGNDKNNNKQNQTHSSNSTSLHDVQGLPSSSSSSDNEETPLPTTNTDANIDKNQTSEPNASNQQPSAPEVENDQEVAQSFDIQRWLTDASKAILNPSKESDTVVPSPPPERPKQNSPPRRKQQPPSPPPEENLYKPPFGPKRTEKPPPPPSSPPPPPPQAAPTSTNDDENDSVDDFFN